MVAPADLPFILSEHARCVVEERGIRLEWITAVLAAPGRTEADKTDPGLRHALARVEDSEGRVLRVVYNPAQSPPIIVTAYFDRSRRDTL